MSIKGLRLGRFFAVPPEMEALTPGRGGGMKRGFASSSSRRGDSILVQSRTYFLYTPFPHNCLLFEMLYIKKYIDPLERKEGTMLPQGAFRNRGSTPLEDLKGDPYPGRRGQFFRKEGSLRSAWVLNNVAERGFGRREASPCAFLKSEWKKTEFSRRPGRKKPGSQWRKSAHARLKEKVLGYAT